MTYVYRAYSQEGALLYVGMSDNVERRLEAHRSSKSEWVGRLAKVTVQPHPDRAAAAVAELEAIRSERPLYNVSGSGGKQSPIRLIRIAERVKAEACDGLFYTAQETADKLNRSLGAVYDLIAAGELQSVKSTPRGRHRIPADALEAYVTKLVDAWMRPALPVDGDAA
jgi:excisionase family DNA binding protein